jgi:hypothetical protein
MNEHHAENYVDLTNANGTVIGDNNQVLIHLWKIGDVSKVNKYLDLERPRTPRCSTTCCRRWTS